MEPGQRRMVDHPLWNLPANHPQDLAFRELYGSCGVVAAVLNDPFSQVIRKITGDNFSVVGFYYGGNSGKICFASGCLVSLFQVHDGNTVPWIPNTGFTMDKFLDSAYVEKISFYRLIKPELESKFCSLAEEAIILAKKSVRSKEAVYTRLFRWIAGISSSLPNSTGYHIINQALCKLDTGEIPQNDDRKVISYPFLGEERSIISRSPIDDSMERDLVISAVQREMEKLAAVFIDLFSTDRTFSSRIISLFTRPDLSQASKEVEELSIYLSASIGTESIDLPAIMERLSVARELLEKLQEERVSPGSCVVWRPRTTKCSLLPGNHEISSQYGIGPIAEDETFTRLPVKEERLDVTNEMDSLGEVLRNLVRTSSSSSSSSPIIDLTSLFTIYNRLAEKLNTASAVLPSDLVSSSYPALVVTSPLPQMAEVTLRRGETILIPSDLADLNGLTSDQLLGLIEFLDSSADTRFIPLQNRAAKELALRRGDRSNR